MSEIWNIRMAVPGSVGFSDDMTCATCRWGVKFRAKSEAAFRQCAARPPIPMIDGGELHSISPRVGAENTCGEWTKQLPRPPKPEPGRQIDLDP